LDYYKLLQIDTSAEHEIIELAYKRMAKKYHPDVCDKEECLEKMRQLNDAYQILKDPALRRQYDLQRMVQQRATEGVKRGNPYLSKNQNLKLMMRATHCLIDYFDAIKRKEYYAAYQLINASQREIMSLEVFRNWQHWISKVYSIVDFNVNIKGYEDRLMINHKSIDCVIAFEIEVLEFNQIMEHFEKDRFVKKVFFENDNPAIYLEQTEVSESILRYEKLAKMKIGNWQKERVKLRIHSGKNTTTFFSQLELEIERYARYQTPFSLVFISVNNVNPVETSAIVNVLQSVIQKNTRKLDRFILLDRKTFLIMLPGTKLIEGSQFAEKICDVVINKSGLSAYYFTIRRTVIENDLDQMESLKQLIKTELTALNLSVL